MYTLWLKYIRQSLRALAPYLFVELVLPGGTFLALLLWLSQHAKAHLVRNRNYRQPDQHTLEHPLAISRSSILCPNRAPTHHVP